MKKRISYAKMMGPYAQSYLPFGDLLLTMEHGQTIDGEYSRKLDLSTGVGTVSYVIGGVRYTREVFASHPDQAIIVRLTASEEHRLSFRAKLDSPLRHRSEADGEHYTITGHAPEYVAPNYYEVDQPVRYGGESPGVWSSTAVWLRSRLEAAWKLLLTVSKLPAQRKRFYTSVRRPRSMRNRAQ